jgi:hypothetical protein
MNSESHSRPWLLVSAVYVALVLACFSPWWLQGKVFAPLDILNEMLLPWRGDKTYPNVHNHFVSDAVTQYLPYHLLAFQSLREDGYIGWNPYSGTGSPLHANTMALPGDWTLQLYRIFDFWTGWHLGLIGQFLVAGLGMLALLKNRGIKPWCALAGAIVFAGNAQFIIWFYHRWALGAFCWMPWIFWALFRCQTAKGGFGLLAAAFLSLAFLGGTLQHMVYTVLAVACFWGGEVVGDRISIRDKFFQTAQLALIGLLGFLLALPVLWPCILAYIESKGAGDSRGAIGYPHGLLQAPLNAIAYGFNLFPSLLGSPQSIDGWKVLKSDLLNLGWIGTLPGIVAFLSIFRRTAPTSARLLIIVGLAIPLTPLVGPLYHRVLLLFAFGGAWAFSDFLSNARAESRLRVATWAAFAGGLIVTTWTLISIALLWFAPLLKEKVVAFVKSRLAQSQFGMFDEWFLARSTKFVDGLFIWSPQQFPLLVLVIVSIGLLYAGARHSLKPQIWQAGIALILALELCLLASRWITVVDPSTFPPYKETAEIAEIKTLVGDGRVFIGIAGHSIADDPLTPNLPTVFQIGHLEVYESIRTAGPWAATSYQQDLPTLKRLGISHIISKAGAPTPEGCITVYQGQTTSLHALPDDSTGPSETFLKIISPNRIHIELARSGTRGKIPITYSKHWIATSAQGEPLNFEQDKGGLSLVPNDAFELRYFPNWFSRYPTILPLLTGTLGVIAILYRKKSRT